MDFPPVAAIPFPGLKIKFTLKYCSNCLKTGRVLRCSHCKETYYCDKECQKKDWEKHVAWYNYELKKNDL